MEADVLIIGAGAAGLMAGIFAGRVNPDRRIVLLDGASRIGTKILISGGGRCNVTHDQVDESAFAGSSGPGIRKVLRRFDVQQTVAFFAELGVTLKREDTGKLFPVTDRAQTVLDALLKALNASRVHLLQGHRVQRVVRQDGGFRVEESQGSITARKVVLATGGQSVPKTGSDGHGYSIARGLGHSLTRIFPSLVPLLLPAGNFLRELTGISATATLEVRSASGKRLASFTDSALCTHFGLSGPVVLDISRYYLESLESDAQAELVANWLPETKPAELDALLQQPGAGTVLSRLRGKAPERLLRGLCLQTGVDPTAPCAQLTREARQALVRFATRMTLPITGTRGFAVAEATAGGVPLNELRLDTMESRVCSGLHLCGEICDVDGRIGGYNFQWAWASGYVAGISV